MQLVERIASRRYDGTLQPNKTPAEKYCKTCLKGCTIELDTITIIIIILLFLPATSVV